MTRKRIGGIAALAVASVVLVLAVTPLGGAAVRHISDLIAPTSKSAVAQINAYFDWNPSTFSRDGFSKVSHPEEGVYCLSGRANPDKSMLLLTVDAQHSLVGGGTAEWDRSSPDCASSEYEVITFCPSFISGAPVGEAPVPNQEEVGIRCDYIAFFAEAFVRA
jgi:hypothetical protein